MIGAGTMGSAIAAVLARDGGYMVTLIDETQARAERGVELAHGVIAEGERRGKYAAAEGEAARERVAGAASLLALGAEAVAVVIEAVPEDEALKRRVLAHAESLAPALLASNTSSISIDALASGLQAPERFVGLHFFNPVAAMELVEVVLGRASSQATRELALALVARIGKQAVCVSDAPGFATSRLGILLGLEAIRMVEQGVASAADIDRAMVLGYRHPVGPLRLSDIVGLDVRLDIARNLQASYGERFAPPRLLEQMVADGLLGKKTGRGFYVWEE